MRVSEVSRRYAKALYELAKTNKTSDRVFEELRTLQQVFTQDKTIAEFIASPVVRKEQKAELIKKTFTSKASQEVLNTLSLLAERNRLEILPDIVVAYEEISDEDHGVTRGTVRSATALSPESRKRIEETVNKVTGKKVILNFTEDPKLLGGMVAQVGGWTFDDSLESHLTRLSEDLNRREM